MTQLATIDTAVLTRRLGDALLRDRMIILGLGPLAVTTRHVEWIRIHGGRRPLVLARGLGTGPLPSADDADIVMLDLQSASSITADLTLEEGLLADPPPEIVAAVDAYDQGHEAVWWLAPHFGASTVAGRPVLGPRRKEWIGLEDKTVIDEVFDACGVPRPPSVVTDTTFEALTTAAEEIDRGSGTVWSGDSRGGVNGGGELVRWVHSDNDARTAADLLARECDRARVAPFIDGVPCSIHGIVMPDGVAVVRPIELLMLRRGGGRFLYCGMASWWDPPAADREQMREAAHRIGVELDRRVGFRGGFSVDGILGADGWLPTEVNTRFSGGLGMLSRAIADFPLHLLQLGLVAGLDPGVSAAEVEAALVHGADELRSAATLAFTKRSPAAVARSAHTQAAEPAAEVMMEIAEGSLVLGDSTIGGLVRFTPTPGTVRRGDHFGPLAARAINLANAAWNLDLGPDITAAPDVRMSSGRHPT